MNTRCNKLRNSFEIIFKNYYIKMHYHYILRTNRESLRFLFIYANYIIYTNTKMPFNSFIISGPLLFNIILNIWINILYFTLSIHVYFTTYIFIFKQHIFNMRSYYAHPFYFFQSCCFQRIVHNTDVKSILVLLVGFNYLAVEFDYCNPPSSTEFMCNNVALGW